MNLEKQTLDTDTIDKPVKTVDQATTPDDFLDGNVDTEEMAKDAIKANPELQISKEDSTEKKQKKISAIMQKIKEIFVDSDEKKLQDLFNYNPLKRQIFEKYAKNDPFKAEQYKKAVLRFSNPIYSEKAKDFVESADHSSNL